MSLSIKYSNEYSLWSWHIWDSILIRMAGPYGYAQYHFPEELIQDLMSCNHITGMLQWLNKLRKNAFANVILFVTNDSNSISGIWVLCGQEPIFLLSQNLQVDYELYT